MKFPPLSHPGCCWEPVRNKEFSVASSKLPWPTECPGSKLFDLFVHCQIHCLHESVDVAVQPELPLHLRFDHDTFPHREASSLHNAFTNPGALTICGSSILNLGRRVNSV